MNAKLTAEIVMTDFLTDEELEMILDSDEFNSIRQFEHGMAEKLRELLSLEFGKEDKITTTAEITDF